MAALSAVILGTLIAGQTVMSVAGDRKNAKAARKAGEFEGAAYDEQAADALARGEEAAAYSGSQTRSLTGAQRASLAAQGIDITTGSAADVQANDQYLGQLDLLAIRQNAAREAHGLTQQGEFARMGGRNQAASYNNRAVSTLLSGAASLYGIYDAYGKNSGSSTPRRTRDQGAQ